jgi:hypothetical protein
MKDLVLVACWDFFLVAKMAVVMGFFGVALKDISLADKKEKMLEILLVG